MGAGKKIAISVVSLILVVGAVIGVVAVVRNNSHNDDENVNSSTNNSNDNNNTNKDSVNNILGMIQNNNSNTNKDNLNDILGMIQNNNTNKDNGNDILGMIQNNNTNKDNGNAILGMIQQTMTSSATSTAIDKICSSTAYKDGCIQSLKSVSQNSSATPKDYIMTLIQTNKDEVNKALQTTQKIVVDKNTEPYDHMAVEDCKELLGQAIDTLQATYSMVGDNELETIQNQVDDLRSWMTSVYALQTTCKDQIQKDEYKSTIEKGMTNATQLTHNAINILAEINESFKGFKLPIPLNFKSFGRRLMGVNSYPSWFGLIDRRLLRGGARNLKPNVVVAKDGSGQYTNVVDAIKAYPKDLKGRFIIYVKAGVCEEFVNIDRKMPNILIYGDGPGKTIITGKRNYAIMKINTMNTATFSNNAPGFIARGITFRNEAGPEGHQAVALRINGDRSVVYNCHIEGHQDTLYYHTSRQFYRNCVISGTVDFIFGMGDAVIQNSLIVVRKPMDNQLNTITADGRQLERGSNGLVLQNCKIVAEDELVPIRFKIASYLGRPWKEQALTVVMQTEIGDFIRPEGWIPWSTTDPKYFFHNTCQYSEFANRGPGAATEKRSKEFKKFKVLNEQEAIKYTMEKFLQASEWLKGKLVPYQLGL
jgi:pectinesterase